MVSPLIVICGGHTVPGYDSLSFQFRNVGKFRCQFYRFRTFGWILLPRLLKLSTVDGGGTKEALQDWARIDYWSRQYSFKVRRQLPFPWSRNSFSLTQPWPTLMGIGPDNCLLAGSAVWVGQPPSVTIISASPAPPKPTHSFFSGAYFHRLLYNWTRQAIENIMLTNGVQIAGGWGETDLFASIADHKLQGFIARRFLG